MLAATASADAEHVCSWCQQDHCAKCQELTELAGGSACRCTHEKQVLRSGPDIEDAAREAPCPQCWAYPRRECAVLAGGRKNPLHYKRYERVNRKGLISDAELVLAAEHMQDGYVVWEPDPEPVSTATEKE